MGVPHLGQPVYFLSQKKAGMVSVLGEFSATDQFRDLWVTVSSTSKEPCMNKHWVKNRLELR